MTHVYDNTTNIFETYNPKLSNLSNNILINTYFKFNLCIAKSLYVSTSPPEINILWFYMMTSSFLRHYSFCSAIMSFHGVTFAVSRVWGPYSFLSTEWPPLLLCLFWLFGVFRATTENFSLMWRRHHYRWRAANFDLYSTLMTMEQWVFFSVPRLLWHGASVYKCHFRGPVTLTPIAERLAVKLSLPVCTN